MARLRNIEQQVRLITAGDGYKAQLRQQLLFAVDEQLKGNPELASKLDAFWDRHPRLEPPFDKMDPVTELDFEEVFTDR